MAEENFENQELIAKLPKEGVHCYAGNPGKINRNRIVSAIFFIACAVVAGMGLIKSGDGIAMLVAGICGSVLALIFVLVFAQTFLVAKYRVAVDYNEKNIVLRYRYSKILIPFENFDAREGTPDQAEALIDKNFSKTANAYLVLDDVFEDACYQTSINDLESKEDFEKLKADCFAIAEAYGARNSKDKVKFYYEKGQPGDSDADESTDVGKIINEAKAEQKEAKRVNGSDVTVAEETEEKAEEAEDDTEEAETESKTDEDKAEE